MNPDTEIDSTPGASAPEPEVSGSPDPSHAAAGPESDAPSATRGKKSAPPATDAAPATSEPAPDADTPEPDPESDAEATPPTVEPEADAADAAQKEVAALTDRLLRLQADFDNYRKRQARERSEWIAQANADLLEDLLPALDQTDLALSAAGDNPPEAAKPFIDGFTLVRKSFLAAVAKHGLEPIASTVGKPLDITTSEAVTVMRTGQAKPGSVIYETRRGYTLGGKLLRAAQVVVEAEAEEGKPAAQKAAEPANDSGDGPSVANDTPVETEA